MISFNKM